jgi:putative phosphoribosyl transferase
VRKLGAPNQPELGMGAVAEGPRVDIDADLVDALGVTPHQLRRILRREAAEVRRRVARLRPDRPPADLRGRTAILVDDGLATGGTMRAAIRAVRKRGARRVVVAVPVGAPGPLAAMAHLADEVVCPLRPEDLFAIGAWYADFRQVSDDEVGRILGRSRLRPIAAPDGEPSPARP